MKLQLDTTEKVIRIDEDVNLGELAESLERLLPFGKWKEFKLETSVQIEWTNPFVPIYPLPYPTYPWITYCDTRTCYDLNYGTYNILTPEP